MTGEDNLVQITLAHLPSNLANSETKLEAPAGGTKIQVWTTSIKGTQVTLPATWSPTSMPAELYVEGYATSGAMRDVTLTLSYILNGTQVLATDSVTATVVSIGLKSVAFSGDSRQSVRKDDNSGDYAPMWEDPWFPYPDYDGLGNTENPVCYVRNNKMQLTPTYEFAPAGVLGDSVVMGGVGPDGMNFPAIEVAVSAMQTSVWAVQECTVALANQVAHYSRMAFDWLMTCANPKIVIDPAESDNEVFVTLNTPQCSPRFRTVLHLATKNGGTDADSCWAGTWQSFGTGSAPADVCAWDETAKNYTTRKLYYYLGDGYAPDPPGGGVDDTPKLLAYVDGQCTAWADMFVECLKSNGITDYDIVELTPPTGNDHSGWFYVHEVTMDQNGPPEFSSPWLYAGNTVQGPGAAGQNCPTPFTLYFEFHEIVRRTLSDDTEIYSDPSYGVSESGIRAYTQHTLGFWEGYFPNITPAHRYAKDYGVDFVVTKR